MKVEYSDLAVDTLENISEFIDDMNISGAGERWIKRFSAFVNSYAKLRKTKWALCRNKDLADEGMSCIVYKGWVVVFKIEFNTFRVYEVVHGSLLL